jgi:hypothetical protein
MNVSAGEIAGFGLQVSIMGFSEMDLTSSRATVD